MNGRTASAAPFDAAPFDAVGDFIGWSELEVVTLTGLVGPDAWAHNPLDPTTSVRVKLAMVSTLLDAPSQPPYTRAATAPRKCDST